MSRLSLCLTIIDNYHYQHLRQKDPSAVAVAQPDNAEQVLGLQRGEEEACVLLGRDRSDTHHILKRETFILKNCGIFNPAPIHKSLMKH